MYSEKKVHSFSDVFQIFLRIEWTFKIFLNLNTYARLSCLHSLSTFLFGQFAQIDWQLQIKMVIFFGKNNAKSWVSLDTNPDYFTRFQVSNVNWRTIRLHKNNWILSGVSFPMDFCYSSRSRWYRTNLVVLKCDSQPIVYFEHFINRWTFVFFNHKHARKFIPPFFHERNTNYEHGSDSCQCYRRWIAHNSSVLVSIASKYRMKSQLHRMRWHLFVFHFFKHGFLLITDWYILYIWHVSLWGSLTCRWWMNTWNKFKVTTFDIRILIIIHNN